MVSKILKKKVIDMEDQLKNLNQLDTWVQKTVAPFCQNILQCFPGRIRSICLYGSAAVGDHIHKRSDINLMIMVDTLQMADLQACLKLIKKWRKKGISAPLLFTEEHIRTSTDAFPVEFLEMKEKHIHLYGEDPFIQLDIDPKNLRLQCEQQIKGKLIRLRQAYLEVGLKRHHMLGLLTTSFSSLLPVMRNTIRLIEPNTQPPKANQEIIMRVCKDFQLDNEILFDILNIKRGILKPNKEMLDHIFDTYLSNLTELAKRIDQIKVDCICAADPEISQHNE